MTALAPAAPAAARFTLDGSDALEARVSALCAASREGVLATLGAGNVHALLLAGGYGRGEGGVLRRADGSDAPYNDLEFFVLLHGHPKLAPRRWEGALHRLGHELTPDAGIDVEFKAITLATLEASAPSMFYYDLVMGHRWLVGDESMLARCGHHRDGARIPLHEATRLLFNRCSGLLFAKERLARPAFTAEDADFVGRNLAKARLAFGDVWLTAHHLYHWSCRERHERLGRLTLPEWAEPLLAHHAAGVEFKLHPVRTDAPRATLASEHAELVSLGEKVWLWLEGRRLERPFDTAAAYLDPRVPKCPEQPAWRNALVNLRTFGPRGLLGPAALRYPRERLFHELVRLLFLGQSGDLAADVSAYEQLWSRYN